MTTAGSGRRADGPRRLSEEEEALLELAMREVKPRRRRSKPPAPPTVAEASPTRPAPAPARTPSAPARVLPPLDPEGAIAGLDKRTAERFARGQLAIDGRLDLHGLHQAAAHRELEGFIAASAAIGRRLVLVITGKGGGPAERRGVLREAAPRWLNEAPMREKILAVRPARPQHGGDGALYVLLKRRR